MSTRRLVTDAILVALYVVLNFYTIRLGWLNISLAAFPILVAALLYGWADGLIVGAMSGFLSQLLTYGLSLTTAMWMLPTLIRGLMVGLYATKHRFDLSRKQIGFIVLLSCLAVTLLNTAALYVDGLIYHYPVALTLGTIALRFVSSIVMAVIFTLITPKAIQLLRAAGSKAA